MYFSGAKVILACRDEKKAEKARTEIITHTGNRRVVTRKLDLASLKSIRDFASEIAIGKSGLMYNSIRVVQQIT